MYIKRFNVCIQQRIACHNQRVNSNVLFVKFVLWLFIYCRQIYILNFFNEIQFVFVKHHTKNISSDYHETLICMSHFWSDLDIHCLSRVTHLSLHTRCSKQVGAEILFFLISYFSPRYKVLSSYQIRKHNLQLTFQYIHHTAAIKMYMRYMLCINTLIVL